MKELSDEQIEKIISLLKKGVSLPEDSQPDSVRLTVSFFSKHVRQLILKGATSTCLYVTKPTFSNVIS